MGTFKGLFSLQSPKDLLAKLEHDFQRMKESPTDSYAAFDFFVAAEHMLDWVYPSDEPSRRDERLNNVLLQVCSHIANGSKHFVATAKHHNSVKQTREVAGGFQANAFQADAFDVGHLMVDVDGNAASQLGPSIEIIDLASRVLEFWRKHPRLQ